VDRTTAKKFKNLSSTQVEDYLTVEEMLSISINNEPYTITMRSPGSEKDLVRGILLTEDILRSESEEPKYLVTQKNVDGHITAMNVLVPEELVQSGIESKRNLMSVSSCGMCGKQEAELDLGEPLSKIVSFKADHISTCFNQMREAQNTFSKSGGSHAAAAFDSEGQMLVAQEDIGRHNAVDKVIGHLIRNEVLDKVVLITISGRVSYEIISKAYKAKIPIVAAVSAPSSKAVQVSQDVGITLLAFCRDEQFTIYSREKRILT